MKMRKMSFFSIAMILLIVSLCSCQAEERIIVQEFGFTTPSMGFAIADVNNIEAVTELSSQVVLCHVDSLEEVEFTDTNNFNFRYKIEILDILMDTSEALQAGDIIEVTSSEGILKASEAAALIKDTPRAQKLGILQGEYQDNEYIVSSTWDAIPIEVGKTYVMYLTDRYLESEGVYAESGRSFLYEYSGKTIYSSRSMEKSDTSLAAVISDIEAQIALRTGRADEVGADQYMEELGARQQAEREENTVE